MSRTHDMNCEQVRKQAYRYRRNELIGAETAAIEAHVEECDGCRDYYERLGILLDAASSWDTDEEASDADDLFAGIAARIEEAAEVADEPEQTHEEEIGYDAGSRGWLSAVAGLAAGVLLTLGALYVWQQADAPSVDEEQGMASVETNDEDKPKASGQTDEPSFAKLAREESASKQVRVFASDGAKWSLSGEKEFVLDLDEGSLLVEFLPEGGQTLQVKAPDFSVRVVGTVFYVSADEKGPRAGVVAGEVEVSPEDGETTTLTARREVGPDFEPRDMSADRTAELARYVDPEEHLQKLSRAEAKPEKRHNKRKTTRAPEREDAGVARAVQPEPEKTEPERRLPPDLERLRSRAERATRQGQYHDAVRYYRGLLERLPPVHPIAASVHLDVAHIYLHRLNSPGRAAPYLRTFVERWPTDVAAPSARKELCKIAEQTGEPEPGCEVQP